MSLHYVFVTFLNKFLFVTLCERSIRLHVLEDVSMLESLGEGEKEQENLNHAELLMSR